MICVAVAGRLFERLVAAACERLQSLKDFSDEPDIADDTFLLAGRGLSYCPAVVLTPAVLPRLIQAATTGVLVQHRRAPVPSTAKDIPRINTAH